jgi:hypothetical protein
MSSSRLFRLTAVAVIVAGIAMAVAGGTMSAWAWTMPGTHVVFRIALPLLTVWLSFTLVRLALALPQALKDEAESRGSRPMAALLPDPLTALAAAPEKEADDRLRRSAPDALSVRQVPLPREPEPRRRRRVAQRIELRDGRTLYRVVPVRPAPIARRVAVAATVLVACASLFFLLGPLDLEDMSWIASLFRALEELPGLFQPVEAGAFLAALGLGARRRRHGP